ncbi:MAG: Dabb family protein [Syntrophothermus sp.]
MIRHIVMFRLKTYPSPEEKQKAAEAVLQQLKMLPEKISVVKTFEAGINFSSESHAFDLVLDSTFDSAGDLEKYRIHPDHQAFIAFNKDYTVEKAVVDFNIS